MTSMYRIALITVLMHLAFAGGRVTISLFAIKLGATTFTIGVVMALVAVVPMLFSVSWGRYVDRVGIRRPMYMGASASLIGLLAVFAVPRLETLFLTSALIGSGFYLCHIAVSQAAGLIGSAEHRVRNFTTLALAFSAASFLGPVVAGFAIDAIEHRRTFLALTVPLIVVLTLMLVRPLTVPRPAHALKGVGERHLMDLVRMPTMRRVFVVSGSLSVAWDVFSFIIPIHGSRLGLPASTVGMILGVFGAAVFVVRAFVPIVSARVKEWNLLIGAMFLSGTVLAAIPFVTSVPLLMALGFVLGIGLGGAQPMIMALIYEKAPPGRAGEAVGVRTLLINFSQTGIPLMFGAVGATLGVQPVFWTVAAMLVGGGLYARRRG